MYPGAAFGRPKYPWAASGRLKVYFSLREKGEPLDEVVVQIVVLYIYIYILSKFMEFGQVVKILLILIEI